MDVKIGGVVWGDEPPQCKSSGVNHKHIKCMMVMHDGHMFCSLSQYTQSIEYQHAKHRTKAQVLEFRNPVEMA